MCWISFCVVLKGEAIVLVPTVTERRPPVSAKDFSQVVSMLTLGHHIKRYCVCVKLDVFWLEIVQDWRLTVEPA